MEVDQDLISSMTGTANISSLINQGPVITVDNKAIKEMKAVTTLTISSLVLSERQTEKKDTPRVIKESTSIFERSCYIMDAVRSFG